MEKMIVTSEMSEEKKRAHRLANGRMIAGKTVVSIIIWAAAVIMVMPFLWMVSASFKTSKDVFNFPIEWIPANPTLKGYILLFRGGSTTVSIPTSIINSIKTSAMSMVGTFFACSLAGYAYAKIKFKGRDTMFMIKLSTTMIPSLVTMLPTYIVFAKIGLYDTLAALWLPYFLGGTFGVFLMRQAFMSIPDELLESARIDGAGNFRCYWNIAIPNVKPALATLVFLYFVWSWNDYTSALLYLRSTKLFTLPYAVATFSSKEYQNYPAIMAADCIMLAPIMIFFFTCQDFFVNSLVTSGMKS